ncbi:hypothetical protein LTR49_001931 [Elasticomyces elasticus]|nr:hypothetical protein LTR49_001931 [Elasticomyces elasticus]KAK5766703.1 hypothetical protein LTS12_003052 [Elasticomyces elasticus]
MLPIVDEEAPAVTDQKAEKKAAKKERNSEMKALLKAGGKPEIKNDSDRKLWKKVKADEESGVINEEDEEGEFVGFGDDDSGFAEYDFNCTDDGIVEPEQLTYDLQAQTQSIASELNDGVMRPVVNDEITIDGFEMIDDVVPQPSEKYLIVKLKIGRGAAMNMAAGPGYDMEMLLRFVLDLVANPLHEQIDAPTKPTA